MTRMSEAAAARCRRRVEAQVEVEIKVEVVEVRRVIGLEDQGGVIIQAQLFMYYSRRST